MPDNSPQVGGQGTKKDESSMPGIGGVPLLLHALEIAHSEGSSVQERIRATEIIGQYDDEQAVNYMFSLLASKTDHRLAYRAQRAMSVYDPSLIIPLVLQNIGALNKYKSFAALSASVAAGEAFLPVALGLLDGSIQAPSKAKSKEGRESEIERIHENVLEGFANIVSNIDIVRRMDNPYVQSITTQLFDMLEGGSDKWKKIHILNVLATTKIPRVEMRLFEYAKGQVDLDNYIARKRAASQLSRIDPRVHQQYSVHMYQIFPHTSFFVAKESFTMFQQAFTQEDLNRMSFAVDLMWRVGYPESGYKKAIEAIKYLDERAQQERFGEAESRDVEQRLLYGLGEHATSKALPLLRDLAETFKTSKGERYYYVGVIEEAIRKICERNPEEC